MMLAYHPNDNNNLILEALAVVQHRLRVCGDRQEQHVVLERQEMLRKQGSLVFALGREYEEQEVFEWAKSAGIEGFVGAEWSKQ